MKKYTYLLLIFGIIQNVSAAPPPVISNHAGDTSGFPEENIQWYAKNIPNLPIDYVEKNDFVHYAPLTRYEDEVNWSLTTLNQFKEISKDRWFRVPSGEKIKRDSTTGVWTWPVGSETAKLIRVKVKDSSGQILWKNVELRLARKLTSNADHRTNWAMATYIQDKPSGNWRVVMPPELNVTIKNALTLNSGIRSVHYVLTAPQACMTCHAQATNSPVDYRRGSEFVYGANDELLTGVTLVPRDTGIPAQSEPGLFAYHASDLSEIKSNRSRIGPYTEGRLPSLK